jgi:hypothetical protein
MRPGEEVEALAASLRGLADALTAFDSYRPGTFLALDEVLGAGTREDSTEDEE